MSAEQRARAAGASPTSAPVTVLETARLRLRHLTTEDAPFMLRLLNEPSFIQFIGDRGVSTIDQARAYIEKGPLDNYARFGFGLYLVVRKGDGASTGICGLLKRDTLPDVDVGFAFLPEYWSYGYAYESASAVMAYANNSLGIRRILAVVSPGNERSIRLLRKLGMRADGRVRLAPGETELELFVRDDPTDSP